MPKPKLPAWFQIERYKAAHDFGAAEWYAQLIFRKRIFDYCEACQKTKENNFGGVSNAFRLIQSDPVITEQRIVATHVAITRKQSRQSSKVLGDEIIRTSSMKVDPVIGVTVQPLEGSAVTLMTSGHRGEVRANYKQGIGRLTSDNIDSWEFAEPPLLWRGQPVVAIDLSIKDEIVIREMRDLLRELRKKKEAPKLPFVKSSDFQKWYKSGVLPYLDLLIWEKIGHGFTWASFLKELNQILDAPISSESAAIKAAETYAEKLLDDQTLRTLEAQAARERRSMTKKSGKLRLS